MDAWSEYDSAAEWCAKRGIIGRIGDRLPENLSRECYDLINDDFEAFQKRIRESAYALAMNKTLREGC